MNDSKRNLKRYGGMSGQVFCLDADVASLEAENERLLQLAADVLKAANWPDGDEICADLQDIYAKHGLMVIVNATEPCGENCACADWDAFPMECYRYCELLKAILNREQEGKK